jgi:hypothetical protein
MDAASGSTRSGCDVEPTAGESTEGSRASGGAPTQDYGALRAACGSA